ncbi:MAG: hypothetical protein JST16_03505 [Bdellovibrionales bacterium]|nr:hypothetical protein [Bdellovibrionales bacterium]
MEIFSDVMEQREAFFAESGIREAMEQEIAMLRRLASENPGFIEGALELEAELADGEEVVVESYREHPVVREIVESFLKKGNEIQLKGCFDNSLSLAQFDERVVCVEGYIQVHGLPTTIEHAWNCFEGFHFDLTAELALQRKFAGYLAVRVFEKADAEFCLGADYSW